LILDDLRLQFSQTSTISFAIPYGLPGNANSRRQGRMAIETRVHNLWVWKVLILLPSNAEVWIDVVLSIVILKQLSESGLNAMNRTI
jgi:hypothetical protein